MNLNFHFKAFGILLCSYFIIVCIDLTYSKALRDFRFVMPESAHHITGELPIIEQFDDGRIESIEERIRNIEQGTSSQPTNQGICVTGYYVYGQDDYMNRY